MSIILDVILVAPNEADAVAHVNRTLARVDTERRQQFHEIDMSHAGGTKFFMTTTYAAAFNHLEPFAVAEAITDAPWEDAARVIVVVDGGSDWMIPLQSRTVEQLRAATWARELDI